MDLSQILTKSPYQRKKLMTGTGAGERRGAGRVRGFVGFSVLSALFFYEPKTSTNKKVY